MPGDSLKPEKEIPGGTLALAAPVLWAAFIVLLVVLLTQSFQLPYSIIDRSLGSTQTAEDWVFVSTTFDASVFTGLGLAVLFVHSYLGGTRGAAGALSNALAAAFALGLIGLLFLSKVFLVLTGCAFIGMLLIDAARLSPPTRRGIPSALSSSFLWIVSAAGVLSAAGSATWIAAGAGGAYPVELGALNAVMVSLGVLGLTFPFVSVVILIFLFAWVLLPVAPKGFKISPWRPDEANSTEVPTSTTSPWPAVLLVLATAMAVYVRLYAYLPAINPNSLRVGTDAIRGYACWLGLSPQGVPFNECVWSWWSLHIGALWFLQGINALTNSPDLTMKAAPIVWGVLFDLATYLLVKEGTGDSLLAGVAALFSAVSLNTVVGIDAGILANWLALTVSFVFFAVILRMLRTRNKLYLGPGLALFVAMFLIHPWTWFLMAVILSAYLLLELLQGWRSRRLAKMRLEETILGVLAFLAALAAVGAGLLSPLVGLYTGFETAIGSLSPGNLLDVVGNLQTSMAQWVGGGQADPIWFILGTFGVLAIPSLRGRFGKLLVVWLAAVALAVPFGYGSGYIQERIIFDVPTAIFAAFGVMKVSSFLSQSLPASSPWHFRGHDLVLPVMVLTVTLLALNFDLEYIGFLFRL